MTIAAGWVGSNTVGETGQRWMSAAGPALQLGVPFWMSTLPGRSTSISFSITGAYGADATGLYYGYNSVLGIGYVSGNYYGRQIVGFFTKVPTVNDQQTVTCLMLAGAMSGSVSLIVFGSRYQFDFNPTYGGYINADVNLATNMATTFIQGTPTLTITT